MDISYIHNLTPAPRLALRAKRVSWLGEGVDANLTPKLKPLPTSPFAKGRREKGEGVDANLTLPSPWKGEEKDGQLKIMILRDLGMGGWERLIYTNW